MQEPLTITSFALSLLLVFRTNSSYARFAEARALWGMVLNRSRDLARQCVSFYPTSEWDAKATFVRWTISFSKCLLCHLRPFSSLRDEVSHILSKEEIQILLAADHPVVMCIQVHIPSALYMQTLCIHSRCHMQAHLQLPMATKRPVHSANSWASTRAHDSASLLPKDQRH